jgi:N-terminal half of MaoC dehydratase
MVNHAAEGATGEPFELMVEVGKIREFSRATFNDRQEYQDGTSTQPTFLMTALHWQHDSSDVLPLVEFDRERTLHAEQTFTFLGPPPCAGTKLRGQSRVDRIYTKEGRNGLLTFAEIVTEYHDESGQLVATARMTGVETSPSNEVEGD